MQGEAGIRGAWGESRGVRIPCSSSEVCQRGQRRAARGLLDMIRYFKLKLLGKYRILFRSVIKYRFVVCIHGTDEYRVVVWRHKNMPRLQPECTVFVRNLAFPVTNEMSVSSGSLFVAFVCALSVSVSLSLSLSL